MKLTLAVLMLSALSAGAAPAAETTQKYGFHPESFDIKSFIQPRYSYTVSGEDGLKNQNSFMVKRARFILTSEVAPRITGRLQVNAVPGKVEDAGPPLIRDAGTPTSGGISRLTSVMNGAGQGRTPTTTTGEIVARAAWTPRRFERSGRS